MQIKKNDLNKIFILFLFAHLFAWTLIPSISNTNLPLDTIEALAWGSNFSWGYKSKIILCVRLFTGGYKGSLFQALGNQVFYLTIVRTPFELRNNSFHYFAKILYINDSKFQDHFFNPVF